MFLDTSLETTFQETSTGHFSLERFLLNLEIGPGETVKTRKHDLNYFQVFMYGNEIWTL
jgi:hypothetical protein